MSRQTREVNDYIIAVACRKWEEAKTGDEGVRTVAIAHIDLVLRNPSSCSTVASDLINTDTWITTTAAELLTAQNSDGGWTYSADQASAIEPTALAMLALGEITSGEQALTSAADWLQARQLSDGLFTASTIHQEASWLSPLAALALQQQGYSAAAESALQAILNVAVYTISNVLEQSPYGYDTQIPGWPWNVGGFSFTEPTALAMIFLKRSGYASADKVIEGARFLRDRALNSGGWNYGEPKVLGGELFPAVVPTAMALLALADERDAITSSAEAWLSSQVESSSSLMSLGWAGIALNVLGLLDDDWRSAIMNRWSELPTSRLGPMETALCLLGLIDTSDHPMGVA